MAPTCIPERQPVSYTEAAAIRRYITGKNDFLFFEDFLSNDNPQSNEVFHHVQGGVDWRVNCILTDGLVEMAVWPAPDATVTLNLRSSAFGSYGVLLDASNQQLVLTRSGSILQAFNTSVLESGVLSAPI